MRTGDRRRPSQQGVNLPSSSNGAFSSRYPLIDRESPFDASFTGTNDIESPDASLASEAYSDIIPQFSHNFANVRVHASAPETMQTKLAVNQPGDSYEQEAERVAEQVIRMEALGSSEVPPESGDAKLGANDLLTLKGASDTSVHEATSAPPLVDEVLSSGGGQPLDDSTRSFMEPRFGHDFSKVRMHADGRAAESARSVNALAYTVEQDVVFGADQYAPGTREGQRLLAHELAHVVQQASRQAASVPALGGMSISDPSDSFELAAEQVSDAVMPDTAAPHIQPGNASIHRL